jgi:hypothetical protein
MGGMPPPVMSQPPLPPIFNIRGVEQLFPYGDSKKNNFPGRGGRFFYFYWSPKKKILEKFLLFPGSPPVLFCLGI